jgi:CPA2 family monovalent cation:H+ antiporter-2
MESFLYQASIYLAAAVIAVPIAARLGLGSVLGYLAAGIIIGPVFGLVGAETKDLQHFAEFGVVMMLFLIGLELEPRALWDMRHRLLGLGGMQIVLSTAALMGVAMGYGQPWGTSLAIGLTLSLSSTAIVLQTLAEKRLMHPNPCLPTAPCGHVACQNIARRFNSTYKRWRRSRRRPKSC